VARTNAVKTTRPLASKDSSTPYFQQLFDDALEAARQAEERPVFNWSSRHGPFKSPTPQKLFNRTKILSEPQ
jgi:hypothetical protein